MIVIGITADINMMKCYKSYGSTNNPPFKEGEYYKVIPIHEMDGTVSFYQVMDALGSPWLINEIDYRELFHPPITNASECDCGGDKVSGHHAHWCSKEVSKCMFNL